MTRSLVIDTGPPVALLNRRDRQHGWAKSLIASETTLTNCEAVLTEACFLLKAVPGGPEAVLALWEEEGLRIVPLVAESAAIRHLMRRCASVPMSFADACLVRLMELEPGTTLATCDSDFRIYRRFSRQTVPLVTPAD